MRLLEPGPSLPDEAQDFYGDLPAVQIGDTPIDFERFAESVEWLSEELRSCGIREGCRVGLGIRAGWEFVLVWHVLIHLDVVVVPLDLTSPAVSRSVRDLDVQFVLAHADQGSTLEDIVEDVVSEGHFYPLYAVADDFNLVEVRRNAGHDTHGGLVDIATGETGTADALMRDVMNVVRADGISRGEEIPIRGVLNSRETMVLILACAVVGACVCVDAPYGTPSWALSTAS